MILSYQKIPAFRSTNFINTTITATLKRRCTKRQSSSSTTNNILLKPPLRGVYPVLITPFHTNNNESIDVQGFRSCISFMKNQIKCNGITIAGVLGESNRLLDSEKQLLIETAKNEIESTRQQQQQDHLFQLCVGVTHTGTAAVVAMVQMAVESGVDAVMVSPTKDSFNGPQPSEDDIYFLYEQIAQVCPSTTIVLQDLPSSSGVYLSIDLLAKILSTIPQVQTIKLESLPTVSRLSALRTHEQLKDIPYTVLTGLGALYAGYDINHGSDGFMTGFAFPEILMLMNTLVEQKQYEKARQVYQRFLTLIVFEQQPGEGLAIRKEIYKRRGLISSTHVRHPGKNLSPTIRKILDEQLERSFPHEVDITSPIAKETILSLLTTY